MLDDDDDGSSTHPSFGSLAPEETLGGGEGWGTRKGIEKWEQTWFTSPPPERESPIHPSRKNSSSPPKDNDLVLRSPLLASSNDNRSEEEEEDVIGRARREEMKERQRWQPEEDALLRAYVKQYGAKEWGMVSERMGRALHRDPKSCQERWKNYLRPGLKKGSLTPDEQTLLVSLQSRYGNKWKAIAAHLPGRTPKRLGKWWEVFKDKQLKAAAKASSDQPHHHGSASAYEHILDTFAEKHVLPPLSHPPPPPPPLPSLVLPSSLYFAAAASSSSSSSSSPSPPSVSLSLSPPDGWLLLLPAVVQLCAEVEEGWRSWTQHRKEAAWRLSRLEQQMETEKARRKREKVEEVEAKIRRLREEETAWLDRLEEEWRERVLAVRREAEAGEAEAAEASAVGHAKLAGLVDKLMVRRGGGLGLSPPVARDYLH